MNVIQSYPHSTKNEPAILAWELYSSRGAWMAVLETHICQALFVTLGDFVYRKVKCFLVLC